MKRKIIYGLILSFSIFFINGCGSDDKANPIVDNTGPYAFFNATTPIVITKSGGASCGSGATTSSGGGFCFSGGTSCTSCGDTSDSNATDTSSQISNNEGMFISVQLLKHGLVEPGELVQMLPFNIAYGAVVNHYAITDENGRAMFEYEAPVGANYDAIRGQDVTIQAVYLDNEAVRPGDEDRKVDVLLTQDFVLQFR